MVIAARRHPGFARFNLNPQKVVAWSGVLVLHILVLGMMFLPRAPLTFVTADPELPIVPIDFVPVEPPKPPLKPIELPPPVQHFTPVTPPRVTVVPTRPEPVTTASEIVVAEPTEMPVVAQTGIDSGDATLAGAGSTPSQLVTLQTSYAPPPLYPRREIMTGIEGTVELRVLVGVDGRPQTVEVIGGNGNRNLKLAAVRGVKRWKFKPYIVAGEARQVWARVPVVFRIQR